MHDNPPITGFKRHSTGQWRLVRKRKHFYLGTDYDKALEEYYRNRQYYDQGVKPPEKAKRLSLRDACNLFLEWKERQIELGKVAKRQWDDYRLTCLRMCDCWGRETEVTSLTGREFDKYQADYFQDRSPVTCGNEVTRVRAVLAWLVKRKIVEGQIEIPEDFRRPEKSEVRKHRNKAGRLDYSASEIQKTIGECHHTMRAIALVAINAGMGNYDIATLPLSIADAGDGWVDYPRKKTGVARRFRLWPETMEAIQETLKYRPEPRDGFEGFLFITRSGRLWASPDRRDNQISKRWCDAGKRAGTHKQGRGFYSLRRTFRTVADECLDTAACDYLMGHDDGSMGSLYCQRISDARLEAVTDYVREWYLKGGAA